MLQSLLMQAKFCSILLLLAAATALPAASWEWQVSAGPWSLQPLTPPLERLAERVVEEEVDELLAPLLADLAVVSYAPRVAMSSSGFSLHGTLWRRLASGRFGLGVSAGYLRLNLPFSLQDEQAFYFQGVPLATLKTSGQGLISLRTFMLAAQGRWRAWQRGRATLHLRGGLALLRFRGRLSLPLQARLQTLLGQAGMNATLDSTLDELARENGRVPSWSLSPAAGATLGCRLQGPVRILLELSLAQGTSLAAGLGFDL